MNFHFPSAEERCAVKRELIEILFNMSLTHQQLLLQGKTFLKIGTSLITPCNLLAKVEVNLSHYRPDVPRGFQEVKVFRFHDNGTGWW